MENNIPSVGQTAYYKTSLLGEVVRVEKLDDKYSRDVTHLVTIRTPQGFPVIGKRKGTEFSGKTYNFKSTTL